MCVTFCALHSNLCDNFPFVFQFVDLVFMNSVPILFMLSTHYIQPSFFGISTKKSTSVRQSGLFAADVQRSFLTLLSLVAGQRRGQRGPTGSMEVELKAHGSRCVFHVELCHRDSSGCHLRSKHGCRIHNG